MLGMAVYKVPQDVEADDKLIGPFSFRQFIYLIVVAISGALAWFLGQIFIGLAIIPLPLVLFFGALALPLRKDQPMETYLAALISYYFLRPHRRMWDPDGEQELVEITAPRVIEKHLTKDISQTEADRRFSYLADIVDSRGWAVRGVAETTPASSSMNADMYYEAQQAEDILDTSTREYHQIDSRLDQTDAAHKQQLMEQMRQQAAMPPAPEPQPLAMQPSPHIADPYAAMTGAADDGVQQLTINPYPSMQQSVIQPAGAQTSPVPSAEPAENTSDMPPSPDIIKLANNSDLSIETIAHEANRIKQRESLPEEEVVVSLH